MQGETQVYRLKVDASGRIVLPAEARARKHIAEGDTVIITEDDKGLRIRTRDEVLAEAQAFFAQLVPPGVSLSEEILQDRRSEIERDS
jgi:AbrB family looped-hinge helix DNA binding protein